MLDRLEDFLDHHTGGADLGLRLRGEQLAAGVRFVRMVREGQYDIVVGNPPYQGTSKTEPTRPTSSRTTDEAKADLYAAFLERGLRARAQLSTRRRCHDAKAGCHKNFEQLREFLIPRLETVVFADLGWGAFDSMRDNPVLLSSFLVSRDPNTNAESNGTAIAATAPGVRIRTDQHLKEIPASILVQERQTRFGVDAGRSVPGSPIIFSWSHSEFDAYREFGTLDRFARVAQGISTTDDERFIRRPWEVGPEKILQVRINLSTPTSMTRNLSRFVPLIKGGGERRWIEPLSNVVRWAPAGIEIRLMDGVAFRNEATHFLPGIAFTAMGDSFSARSHRYLSVCHNKGTSVFGPIDEITTLLNASSSRAIMAVLNPGIGFEVGDVGRLPFAVRGDATAIMTCLRESFGEAERHRETSVEFELLGATTWDAAQEWAQQTVDRPAWRTSRLENCALCPLPRRPT